MFAEEFEREFGVDAAKSELEQMVSDIDSKVDKLQKKSLTNCNERADNMREIARLKGERENVLKALEWYVTPKQMIREVQSAFSNEEEVTRWVIENSDDINEVLGTYESVKGLQNDVTLPRWQQELQGIKINPESFYREGDRNLATPELKRGWLSREGRNIDEVAHDLSNYGIEVTAQDVVDFMLENPSGRARQKSSELDALGQRFSELASKAAGVKIGKPDSPTGKLFIENLRTSNNMEQLRSQINDAQRAEEEVLKSMAEQRDAERVDENLSDEVDYKGNPFVLNSRGELDFGVVNQEQAENLGTNVIAPIRLSRGNEGYGFEHMKKRFEQLRQNGYDSVEEFVEDVSRNYDEIRQGNLYTDPFTGESKETFLFVKKGKKGDVLYIELSPDGKYYEVNSGGVFKNSYIEKRNLLWNASTEHSTTSGESQDFPSAQLNPESDNVSALSQSESLSEIKDSEVPGENQEEINNVDKIRDAEREVELNPTEAQKEAGNYKKGHVRIDGYDVTIENPKGSERSGTDVNGNPWSNVMNNTYGYIRGTQGVDGDHIDVFLSDSPDTGNVYVVDQIKEDGSFDEHKVMYGFTSIDEARSAYLSNYSPGWKGLGAITEVSKDEFKKWIDSSKRKTKPFSEYKNVKVEDSQIDSPLFREVGNEYTPEEQEIIDRAKKDGSYMKAPNDKPSNLNEKQWAQVRTKAFKDWFGDWENDPESASKVLDENGEPRVVFHGTTNDKETRVWNERSKSYDTKHEPFTVFRRAVDGESNAGHFFNSDKDNAYGYGYNTYDTYLSLQNPLVIDCKGANYSSINYNGETKDTYEWSQYAEKNGYDGVIFENVRDGVDYGDLDSPTTDYVAFKSNQIKSATDNTGDFSRWNDDIRFRDIEDVNRRFNEELDAFESGEHKGDLHLGMPGDILLASGLSNTEMYITPKTLKEHLEKHGLSIENIKNLPSALRNPLLVYEWGDKAKSLVVITNIEHGNERITAAIKLERNGKRLEVNELASVHPKDSRRFIDDMVNAKRGGLKDALKYVSDKKKALDWLGLVPPKGTASLTDQELSIANVIENFENPTLEDGKIVSAVESLAGDLNTGVRIIRDMNDIEDDNPEMQRRKRGAKGWYDPKTGEVVVVLPNAKSVEDAKATVLHEIVGHKGIRGLFGDRIGEFTSRVLDSMPEDERKKWVDKYNGDEQLAAEEYNICNHFISNNIVSNKWVVYLC